MPIDPSEIERTRSRVAQIEAEKQQALGALKELRKQLVEKFGVHSDAQAQAAQEKLDAGVIRLEQQCREALAELDRKWGNRLNGDGRATPKSD